MGILLHNSQTFDHLSDRVTYRAVTSMLPPPPPLFLPLSDLLLLFVQVLLFCFIFIFIFFLFLSSSSSSSLSRCSGVLLLLCLLLLLPNFVPMISDTTSTLECCRVTLHLLTTAVTLWAEGHLLVRDPNKNSECFILKCPFTSLHH